MKQKLFHFIAGLIIYGIIAYFIMYFTQPEQTPWVFTIGWGMSMAIFDVVFFKKKLVNNEYKKRPTRSR